MIGVLEGYEPEEGDVAIAVVAQGLMGAVGVLDARLLGDALEMVERNWKLTPADRADKDGQVELRGKVYALLRTDGAAALGDGLFATLYWLAANHYANGEEFRRVLSDELRTRNRAVVSIAILGDGETMRWGFSVGETVIDFTQLMGEIPADMPIFRAVSSAPSKPTMQ